MISNNRNNQGDDGRAQPAAAWMKHQAHEQLVQQQQQQQQLDQFHPPLRSHNHDLGFQLHQDDSQRISSRQAGFQEQVAQVQHRPTQGSLDSTLLAMGNGTSRSGLEASNAASTMSGVPMHNNNNNNSLNPLQLQLQQASLEQEYAMLLQAQQQHQQQQQALLAAGLGPQVPNLQLFNNQASLNSIHLANAAPSVATTLPFGNMIPSMMNGTALSAVVDPDLAATAAKLQIDPAIVAATASLTSQQLRALADERCKAEQAAAARLLATTGTTPSSTTTTTAAAAPGQQQSSQHGEQGEDRKPSSAHRFDLTAADPVARKRARSSDDGDGSDDAETRREERKTGACSPRKEHDEAYKQFLKNMPDVSRTRRAYDHEAFPAKLYRMLLEVEKNGLKHICSFTPSGEAFRVFIPKVFEKEIGPEYFRHANYASFRRQLSTYGFQRVVQGEDQGAFSHKLFRRGHPELLPKILRASELQKAQRQALGMRTDGGAQEEDEEEEEEGDGKVEGSPAESNDQQETAAVTEDSLKSVENAENQKEEQE